MSLSIRTMMAAGELAIQATYQPPKKKCSCGGKCCGGEVKAYGTSEGVSKEWDARGRGRAVAQQFGYSNEGKSRLNFVRREANGHQNRLRLHDEGWTHSSGKSGTGVDDLEDHLVGLHGKK